VRPERAAGAGRVLLLPLLAGLAAAWVQSPAHADTEDRAQEAFQRPPPAPTRTGPPLPATWEAALRAPDRLGPPPLREADAQLLAAVRERRWAQALALVKSGRANVNARDAAGAHALVAAARAGEELLVRELVQREAQIDRVSDDGFTALAGAAFEGRRGMVRLLLLAGADATRFTASGQTALHLAAVAGHAPVVAELLRQGVPVDLLNRARETALDLAAFVNQGDVMDLLIQRGADMRLAGRR
jgi:Ankyrin repeats (3 copies)